MTLVFKVVLFQVFDDAVHTIGVRSLILGLHSDVHEKIDVYIYIYIRVALLFVFSGALSP